MRSKIANGEREIRAFEERILLLLHNYSLQHIYIYIYTKGQTLLEYCKTVLLEDYVTNFVAEMFKGKFGIWKSLNILPLKVILIIHRIFLFPFFCSVVEMSVLGCMIVENIAL